MRVSKRPCSMSRTRDSSADRVSYWCICRGVQGKTHLDLFQNCVPDRKVALHRLYVPGAKGLYTTYDCDCYAIHSSAARNMLSIMIKLVSA